MNAFYHELIDYIKKYKAKLVAVSKTKSPEKIMELYDAGQRVFGENRAQELMEKAPLLPDDIEWHMIGHLQRNKLKHVLPVVTMIHAIDSQKLLEAAKKMLSKMDKKIDILLQFHIADETSKYGFTLDEVKMMLEAPDWNEQRDHLNICGVMGMATFTDDTAQIKREFESLKSIFDFLKSNYFSSDEAFKEISMGMSGDYKIALDCGSTMVRIGSLLFGERE